MIIDLAVIYTARLEECRDFYTGIGLDFVPERHGNGPAHYSAPLADGGVLELYPATRRPATGHLRLGLTMPARNARSLPTGQHTLTDPDGRTVVLTLTEDKTTMATTMATTEQTARDAVRRILGAGARTDVTVFPSGNLSITVAADDHTAVIDGDDASGWGWSVDPAEDAGFTGHEHTAGSLDEALNGVRGSIGA